MQALAYLLHIASLWAHKMFICVICRRAMKEAFSSLEKKTMGLQLTNLFPEQDYFERKVGEVKPQIKFLPIID